MQGEYQDAYDVLDSISSKSTQHFYRAAVCGFLRHAQVSEVRCCRGPAVADTSDT